MKSKNTVYFFLMHLAFFIYAFYAVLGKLASKQVFFSKIFIFLYISVFLILFVYALLWQQILKKIPLVIATANKTVTIVWGIVFGKIFFDEKVKLNMILGALLILVGIFILMSTEKKIEEQKEKVSDE